MSIPFQLHNMIRVDPRTGCWNYYKDQKSRYPRVKYNGRPYQFHRLCWEVVKGTIPDGLYVCHICDNTKCGNPDHLFLGTQFDNMQDMVSKGRNHNTSGECNGRAKLSWEWVRIIRREFTEGSTVVALSQKYTLPVSTITSITKNRTWKDKNYRVPSTLPANRSITNGVVEKVLSLRSNGMSQTRIAEEVGISQTGVWRILSGIAKVWE